jgi:hypothetical membrane protein
MILLAFVIIGKDYRKQVSKLNSIDWILLITGSIILILGFTWDYSKYVLEQNSFKDLFVLPYKKALFKTDAEYVPRSFNWFLFVLGELVILFGIMRYWRRKK